MLFLKPKPKFDELLPPPPPPPIEPVNQQIEKPKFFDEVISTEKNQETFPEAQEFSDLVKELDKAAKPKKTLVKKEKIISKKSKEKQKIIAKAKLKAKQISTKNTIKKGKNIDQDKISKPSFELPEFELPKELKQEKEIELSDTLEDFSGIKKPEEIAEAEEEIKSAIEKAKEQEKPSFFKRLFSRRTKKEGISPEEHIAESSEANEISIIQENINKAREALMKFDLETAKNDYVEVMRLYSKMNQEDKAKVYQDIKDLYFERKSAEGLKG